MFVILDFIALAVLGIIIVISIYNATKIGCLGGIITFVLLIALAYYSLEKFVWWIK